MAYVPPALRRQKEIAGKSGSNEYATSPTVPTIDEKVIRLPNEFDINVHYWPSKLAADDVNGSLDKGSTLHASESMPDSLQYVMLFRDANPRWETDKIIFVKTHLHLLPATDTNNVTDLTATARQDEASSETVPHESKKVSSSSYPIAVFEQVARGQEVRTSSFKFVGYYKIVRLQYLEPRSTDLIRMLEQKFTKKTQSGRIQQKARDAAAWQASMKKRWAVIEFEADQDATDQLGQPIIEVHDRKTRDDGNGEDCQRDTLGIKARGPRRKASGWI